MEPGTWGQSHTLQRLHLASYKCFTQELEHPTRRKCHLISNMTWFWFDVTLSATNCLSRWGKGHNRKYLDEFCYDLWRYSTANAHNILTKIGHIHCTTSAAPQKVFDILIFQISGKIVPHPHLILNEWVPKNLFQERLNTLRKMLMENPLNNSSILILFRFIMTKFESFCVDLPTIVTGIIELVSNV